ncbi:MAG TPA: phosphatase PAP2 family protein [Candidatus Dormibacteraeota bacterium]|nr:phosphatase PAP2 family protein [Candidatus Dormibacteraeota bacterium]
MRRAALLAGILAVGFTLFSGVVSGGALRVFDRQVAVAMAGVYNPALLTPFRALALLGGLELTTLLAVGLFAYLWRHGHRLGAWSAAALPIASLVELADKHFVDQPSPPLSISHPDGPSLTSFFEGLPGTGWSFPSGHMTRAVVVYGLIAFVVGRLAQRSWERRLAPIVATVLLAAIAFDRLYLAVHWESDVIGALLLGGCFLAAAISWLEWSATRERV